ncbi:ferredoxin [Rhodococcus opacus]|uniref:ferredoxin n=1 Tax=Rhodococcus opacus TaxID=37919 RepID=UPI001C44B566|nr:ferredoxin [Rhodococcus opacus]
MKISVDWDVCQGHGKCYLVAQELFAPDDDDEWGRPIVTSADVADGDSRIVVSAERAASSCPERAIHLQP